jgi:hypothetical protein
MIPDDYSRAGVVEVGGNLEELLPTSFLQFRDGILHQWFEATRRTPIAVHTRGEWRPVPER